MNRVCQTTNNSKTPAAPLSCLLFCGLLAASSALSARSQAAEAKPTVTMGLVQFDNEISTLRSHLSGTMAALADVKAAAGQNADLAKPYASFTRSFQALQFQTEKVRQYGMAVKARAKEHWEVWQKDLTAMQNPNLREKAQNRYTATSKQFDKIVERVETAKEAFAPLMADLNDINTYLKTDLSKDAVSSLSGNIWKMGNAARSVDGKLADVSEEIGKTLKKMPQV